MSTVVVVDRAELEQMLEDAVTRALENCLPARDEDQWYRSGKAAEYAGLHPKTLGKFARQGVIPSSRVGRSYRFRKSDLDAFMQRNQGVSDAAE